MVVLALVVVLLFIVEVGKVKEGDFNGRVSYVKIYNYSSG